MIRENPGSQDLVFEFIYTREPYYYFPQQMYVTQDMQKMEKKMRGGGRTEGVIQTQSESQRQRNVMDLSLSHVHAETLTHRHARFQT